MIRWILAFDLMLSSAPALAAHCPYGQIYRVRLHECVGVRSALARGYVQRTSAVSRTDEDHSWYVEITKLPPGLDDDRSRAIEQLKAAMPGAPQ
jgi:hypothetical protein